MRVALIAALSAFACGGTSVTQPVAGGDVASKRPPSPTIAVSVDFSGGSDGILVASNPPGISCYRSVGGPSVCTATFLRGTPVELRAAATLCGFRFEGACAGSTTSCLLDGESDANVVVDVATRCPVPGGYPLSVAVSGRGRVLLGNVPIDCGAFCSGVLVPGTEVLLFAQPAPGATFLGWTGACNGGGDCRFRAGYAPAQVNAAFSP